jgi:hypothetical protein
MVAPYQFVMILETQAKAARRGAWGKCSREKVLGNNR